MLYKTQKQVDKMEMLGHLTGGVVHELNNYLQSVLFAAELVQESMSIDPNARKHVDIVIRNTLAAKSLVQDIILFSQHKDKAIALVDAQSETHRALRIVQEVLPSSIDFKIKKRSDSRDEAIEVNTDDLVIVLSNLALNSAYAIDQKGRIEIAMGSKGEESWYISVVAYSSGISVSSDNKSSDAILQSSFSNPKADFGLETVKRIVTSWGGQLSVEPTDDQSTMFTISIPLAGGAE